MSEETSLTHSVNGWSVESKELVTEETQLDRIEAKLDAVLLFASEMNKMVEGVMPIIAELEEKGPMALFGMLMGGKKK